MKIEEILTDGDWQIGLSKVLGKQIKEIHGYITGNENDGEYFKMTKIEFENGTFMFAEGEHDMPYLTTTNGADERKISQAAKLTKEEEE